MSYTPLITPPPTPATNAATFTPLPYFFKMTSFKNDFYEKLFEIVFF